MANNALLIVIILFQYITGMATGGQASNVSYSSVSQSSDGGICATGSALPSSGMWRHTPARAGPRRERAIRFRDAWVEASDSNKWLPRKLKESLRATHLAWKILREIFNKVLQRASRLIKETRDALGYPAEEGKTFRATQELHEYIYMDIAKYLRSVYLTWIHIATIKISRWITLTTKLMFCEYIQSMSSWRKAQKNQCRAKSGYDYNLVSSGQGDCAARDWICKYSIYVKEIFQEKYPFTCGILQKISCNQSDSLSCKDWLHRQG